MGHRLQHQRRELPSHGGAGSRGREKSHRPAPEKLGAASDLKPVGRDRASVDRARGEGTGHFRKRTNSSTILLESNHESSSTLEENSFALELRRGASKKASGTPVKTLINEMSKDREIRQPSPSLVARLMGLDTLPPPQVVHKQQKKTGRDRQKIASIGFQEKLVSCEDHLCQVANKEDQEFKDVFEVMETSEVQRTKIQSAQKGKSNSKRSEIDLAYVRQKFMDAKRLSTDEALHNSRELDDALEVLDSNKDLFLKFLQEPNTLFTKHLQDLKRVPPSPNVSHITILKSSKGVKYETSEGYGKSERNAERCAHMQKEVMGSFRKPAPELVCHSLKEHSCSPSLELPKSQYEDKTEACRHPTRIVVLKPSVEKVQKVESTISLPIFENYDASYRRHREFQMFGIQELCAERSDREKLSDNVENMLRRSKSSREIAREITRQMRDVRCSTKQVVPSGIDGYDREKVSYIMSDMDNLYSSEAFRWSTNRFDDWSNSLSSSSSCSTESSVSREARKRLSERWKMTHHFQEVGPIGRGSSTLGEMLALSDREIPDRTLDLFANQNDSDEKLASGEAIATCSRPTGISSRDGWKGGYSRNLPRSISLPASSTVKRNSKPISTHRVGSKKRCSMLKDVLDHGCGDSLKDKCNHKGSSSCRSFKYHNHKLYPCNSGEEENKLPEREIHVNQEVRSSIHVADLSEEKPIISEHSKVDIADSHLEDNCLVSGFEDAEVSCIANEDIVEQPMAFEVLGKDGVSSDHDHNDIVVEDVSSGHFELDCLHPSCQLTESVTTESSKEVEQPSPVSVLEPPSEEEKSSSGCFEKISADLKELRMQLRLLKMESTEAYAEELEDVIVSDEDTGTECDLSSQIGAILQPFRDEKDRDFSYLVDMLIISGIRGADWDELSGAFYLADLPVHPSMFGKLEKKYSVVVSWLRSERKLFFDLINSILAENVASFIGKRTFRPILAYKDLAADVWQMVVSHRKELSRKQEKVLEPRWLDLGNDIDIVGSDIEGMLKEDLLEELVSNFILG